MLVWLSSTQDTVLSLGAAQSWSDLI